MADKYDISAVNTTVENSPYLVDVKAPAYDALPEDSRASPVSIDPSLDKWFFISGTSQL